MNEERNKLPPLNALRAFDAVARLGSMQRAAMLLNISPSSITQHIRKLEDFVGAELFIRTANSIELNWRGRQYAAAIRRAFDIISRSTEEVIGGVSTEPVRVSCAPTLAGSWFAEQLSAAEKSYPEVIFRCDFSPALVDFENDAIDIAIRYGSGEVAGAHAELLFTDWIAPVCSPQTAKRIRVPDDLKNANLISSAELTNDGQPLWWYWGQQAVGDEFASSLNTEMGMALESSSFTIEALLVGNSIALLEYQTVCTQIADGRLVCAIPQWIRAPHGYHMLTPKRRSTKPAAKHLIALLTSNAERLSQPPKTDIHTSISQAR